MKLLKLLRRGIIVSGVWIFPISLGLIYALTRLFPSSTWGDTLVPLFILFFGLPQAMIFFRNITRIEQGIDPDTITLKDCLRNPEFDTGKQRHEYPPAPKEMLYPEPIGTCFGKQGNLYVCRDDLHEEGHTLVTGGSGTGKSSCIGLPSIALAEKAGIHQLIIDIKGELYKKTGSKSSIKIDPLDRQSYGFNPFGQLTEKSTDTQLIRTIQAICNSIIPPAKSTENEYWPTSARGMLFGLIYYYYHDKGMRYLSPILIEILSKPIEDSIKSIIEESFPESITYRSLISFHGMPAETLMSVFSNMKNRIDRITIDPDLVYALGYNPKMYTPADLRESSAYLIVSEGNLTNWNQFVVMVINMTLLWAMTDLKEAEDEPDRAWMGLFIDETVALLAGLEGKISLLVQGARFLRSKHFRLTIICQSLAGLRCVYTEDEVNDLLSNFT